MTKITFMTKNTAGLIGKKKWSRRDIMLLLERLEMYVSAGLSPIEALKTASASRSNGRRAAEQSGISKKQRVALDQVRISIEGGGSLSRNLRERLRISPTIAGLIEHGEDSGELAGALAGAKAILEREDALIKTCLSAMAYPCAIGLFAVVLTIGLMRGVMPQIIPLLESLHVQLPLLTRAVIFLSENLVNYGLYALLAAAVIIPSAAFLYRKIYRARFLCHIAVMRAPIIGRIFRHYSLAIMARSLGSLVESGAALSTSYDRVVAAVPLLPIRDRLEKESANISRGIPFGVILSDIRDVPAYVAALVSAGEASGTLGSSLLRSAGILDRDIEHALKRLTALVEPVMMAGMGCAVGAIALSIMMPIYDISKALQH